jgi:hypothetical protein
MRPQRDLDNDHAGGEVKSKRNVPHYKELYLDNERRLGWITRFCIGLVLIAAALGTFAIYLAATCKCS